jgi:hypothetical protein
MKNTYFLILLAIVAVSCGTKNTLLIKQWDVVAVDNLDKPKTMYLSVEDSINTATAEAKMKNLSWQFKPDNTVVFTSGDVINAVAKYTYEAKDSSLSTEYPSGATQYYKVIYLTETDLILNNYFTPSKTITIKFKAR